MKKDTTVYYRVLQILQEFPDTRSDNMELYVAYWFKYSRSRFQVVPKFNGFENVPVVDTKSMRNFADPETISRVRRVIQNDLGLLLPTWEVARGRRIKEEEWKVNIKKDFTPIQLQRIIDAWLKQPPAIRKKVKSNRDTIVLDDN